MDWFEVIKKARDYIKKGQQEALGRIEWVDQKVHSENLDIIGRDDLVLQIQKQFKASPGPIALYGQGGVGKTAAADHYAREMVRAGHYDGAWRVSGESISAAAQDLAVLGAALGVERGNDDEAFFRACLKAMRERADYPKRWLLIHDNVDAVEQQRQVLKRFTDEYKIDHLITSRLSDWGARAAALRLEEPDEAAAVALLAREARCEVDSDLAELAVEVLGKLPLALIIVGADLRATGMSAAEYGVNFRAVLETAPPGTNVYDKSLGVAVRGSFERLEADAQGVMMLSSVMAAEDVDPEYLAKGAARLSEGDDYFELAQDKARRGRAFAQAAGHSLLSRGEVEGQDGPEVTWQVHRMTQEVLRGSLDAEDLNGLIGVAGELGIAQITGQIQFQTERWKIYRRLSRHADALTPLLEAGEGVALKVASVFVLNMALFLRNATGDLVLARRLFEGLLPVAEKAYGRESADFAAVLVNLGVTLDLLARGEADETVRAASSADAEQRLQDALEIDEKVLGARSDAIAYTHNSLQGFYWARKRFEIAETHAKTALSIWTENEAARELLGSSHGNLGAVYSDWANDLSGEVGAEKRGLALHHMELGLQHTRAALGELSFETAMRLSNLAFERFHGGESEAAKVLFVRAAAIPIAILGQGLIEEGHSKLELHLGNLAHLLTKLNDASDPRALAVADAERVLLDHAAWKRGEVPDWPS